jgi:hypothetical protein
MVKKPVAATDETTASEAGAHKELASLASTSDEDLAALNSAAEGEAMMNLK